MALNEGLVSPIAVVNAEILDVSTASSAFVVAPCDGRIDYVATVIYGAIATAPAVITVEINGVAIAGLSISITHTSSAAGDKDDAVVNDIPTARVKKGDVIEFITSGASTNTIRCNCTARIRQT